MKNCCSVTYWAAKGSLRMFDTEHAVKSASLLSRLKIGAWGLPLVIVAITITTALIESRFWSIANLQNLLRQMAVLQILAVGQLFAVLSGGLDLSIAATMALAAVCGILVTPELGMCGGIFVMLLVGTGVGVLNGAFVVVFKVSPLIVTLGTLSIARGLALLLSGGVPLYEVPDALIDTVGFGTLLGVPASSWIAFAVMGLAALVLGRTVFGRHVYAIGSSPIAARNSGLSVASRTIAIYAASGLCAGTAAIVGTAWVSAAQPTAGEGLELQSIAAVVVGGVLLTGGAGTVTQVLLGVVLLSLLSNALNMAGVSSFLQVVFVGAVILISVVADRFRTRYGG
jgi:ribose/xylose/arabinose/galactoside ABC-type transport system permease subunit